MFIGGVKPRRKNIGNDSLINKLNIPMNVRGDKGLLRQRSKFAPSMLPFASFSVTFIKRISRVSEIDYRTRSVAINKYLQRYSGKKTLWEKFVSDD